MIKKIIKILIMSLVISSLYAENILAINLSSTTDLHIIYVNVLRDNAYLGWGEDAHVKTGDKIFFQIHAYANGGDINNLVSKLENINKKKFKKGETENVTAFINADNAEKMTGSVKLTFDNDVQLEYSGYKWATKLKGEFPEEHEHFKELPANQLGVDSMSEEGSHLGLLEWDHRSNLIIFFNTINTEIPESGKCSNEKNKCEKGSFLDKKDEKDYYKWSCNGVYGGSSDNCLLKKPLTDGECSISFNKCLKGYFVDYIDTSTHYRWGCKGLSGGQDKNCDRIKKAENGKCGTKTDQCLEGIFMDVKDSDEKNYWNCKGLNGGKDTQCSKDKYCLCSEINKKCANDSAQDNFIIKKNNNFEDTENTENTNFKGDDKNEENNQIRIIRKKTSDEKKEDSVVNKDENKKFMFNWISFLFLILIIILLIIKIIFTKKNKG